MSTACVAAQEDTHLQEGQCVRVYQAVDGTERLRGARTYSSTSPVEDGGPGRAVRPVFAAPAPPRAGEGSRLVHTREVQCLVALRVCGSRATYKD